MATRMPPSTYSEVCKRFLEKLGDPLLPSYHAQEELVQLTHTAYMAGMTVERFEGLLEQFAAKHGLGGRYEDPEVVMKAQWLNERGWPTAPNPKSGKVLVARSESGQNHVAFDSTIWGVNKLALHLSEAGLTPWAVLKEFENRPVIITAPAKRGEPKKGGEIPDDVLEAALRVTEDKLPEATPWEPGEGPTREEQEGLNDLLRKMARGA